MLVEFTLCDVVKWRVVRGIEDDTGKVELGEIVEQAPLYGKMSSYCRVTKYYYRFEY